MLKPVPAELSYDSPPLRRAQRTTPRTARKSQGSGRSEPYLSHGISEFSLEVESSCLGRSISSFTLDEKENAKGTTDRFIPLRKTNTMDSNFFSIPEENETGCQRGEEMREDKLTLDEMYRSLFIDKQSSKMLLFGESSLKSDSLRNAQPERLADVKGMKENGLIGEARLQKKNSNGDYRKVNKVPFKVLDAPNLQDDFYLNLLEWSSQNVLSVALDSCLYFWNANNNKVTKFCDIAPDSISSIHWSQPGSQIAVGTSRGTIQVWDATKNCRTAEYRGHTSRVSSVAWSDNLLASGSRDRSILLRDVRERSDRICQKYEGHTQQVCGLKWSFDNSMLASGGNDNKLFIWSAHSQLPIGRYTDHCAAVKGIAWSPHNHGVLASGGGTADKTIKFWNTLNNTLLDSIDTGSQVCNLIFSKNTKEIVSTHGYSNNEIIIWKYPTLQKLTTLTGHSSRVLFLAMNPSGEAIVTGAGDETLRFWNVFPGKERTPLKANILSTMQLR